MPRRLPHLSLSAAALALTAATPALAKSDSVPDWVHTAAAKHLPALPSDTNAVVLLDDTTLSVAPGGHASEHHRRVVKILRPQGRDDAAIFLPFSEEEKLAGLHVWSIGPDGHEYALKDKEIGEVGFPGQGNFYVDLRARTARAPGSDPGGVVAVEYDQALPPYLNESTWEFQGSLPSISESFTLDLAPGYTWSAVWAHHPQLKPADLEHGRSRWEFSDVPPIDLHDLSFTPSESALAGRMSVHFAGPGVAAVGDTWPAIGHWYQGLVGDRDAASPELAAEAHELAGSSTDFASRVEPIAEFVQKQVRYFVIERGIGGLQPHPAAEIFRNRFGDCKDKATLLAAMLSSVGIHADLLMVDSHRGAIDPAAPSLYGNHMISAIQIPDGYTSPKLRSVVTAANGHRYLIFDPTWEMIPFGQLEHELQGSYGVLVDSAGSQILQLPLLAPSLNRIDRSASFQLSADGVLAGTVTERRFGDAASFRRYLYTGYTGADQHRQAEFLDQQLSRDLPQFSVSAFKVENVSALNQDLTTSFSLTADRFGRHAGDLLILRPRVLGSEDLLEITHDHPDRHLPVDLHETLQAHDEFTIQLPAGYTADELPEPVKLDLGFAAYESSTTLSGNTLHFARTYTVREITLAPDRYPDVQKLAAAIAADEQNNAVLKKL